MRSPLFENAIGLCYNPLESRRYECNFHVLGRTIMSKSYKKKHLIEIDRELSTISQKVTLSGKDLTISNIHAVSSTGAKTFITTADRVQEKVRKSYQVMLSNIKQGIPVYGSNTAFGGQAGRILNKGDIKKRIDEARKLSEGLVFLDVGVGTQLPQVIVKGAMIIRINMLLQGVSGIRLETLDILRKMLNKQIIPIVPEYGGIGASGDLIHNQRVVSAMRGLPGVKVINEKGKKEEAKDALERNNIPLLQLDPKEGLALVNGDNFSTSFAVHLVTQVIECILIGKVVGAMVIEVLKGTNRSFHPLLAEVRPHQGQKESADIYRYLLQGSKLAHQELTGHKVKNNGVKVQDAYSLRGLSQFEGVWIDKLKWILETIAINANSVSDNPLWVPDGSTTRGEEPWQWVSGGNFLAMHMVEVLDSIRKIMTQLVKRNDRHLARLIDPSDNNGLPANLSDPENSTTQCSFKGIQIQMGMFEIYSMILANPVSTLFGVHEERNQDITSHATTSGNLGLKNLEIVQYSLASNLLALAQAVDLRGGPSLLAPHTRPMYELIRKHSERITKDRPLHSDLEKITGLIKDGTMIKYVRSKIYTEFV